MQKETTNFALNIQGSDYKQLMEQLDEFETFGINSLPLDLTNLFQELPSHIRDIPFTTEQKWCLLREGTCDYQNGLFLYFLRETGQLEVISSSDYGDVQSWLVTMEDCRFEQSQAESKLLALQGNCRPLYEHINFYMDCLTDVNVPESHYSLLPDFIIGNKLSDSQKQLLLRDGGARLNPDATLQLDYVTGNIQVIFDDSTGRLLLEKDCRYGPELVRVPITGGQSILGAVHRDSPAIDRLYLQERGHNCDRVPPFDLAFAISAVPNRIRHYHLTDHDKAVIIMHGAVIMHDHGVIEYSAALNNFYHIRQDSSREGAWIKEPVLSIEGGADGLADEHKKSLYRYPLETEGNRNLNMLKLAVRAFEPDHPLVAKELTNLPNEIMGVKLNNAAKYQIAFENGYAIDNVLIRIDKHTGAVLAYHNDTSPHPLGLLRPQILTQDEARKSMQTVLQKEDRHQKKGTVTNKDQGLSM